MCEHHERRSWNEHAADILRSGDALELNGRSSVGPRGDQPWPRPRSRALSGLRLIDEVGERAALAMLLPPEPEPTDFMPAVWGRKRHAVETRPRPERILIVDDDPDIARFVQVNLQHGGFASVDIAPDGHEALSAAADGTYDLIITGVMMPRMDGFSLVELLRRIPSTRGTPIMFLTAKALVSDRVIGLAAGADDYMIKPFDPIELLARVRALLRRRGRDAA